jgi:hypothetical protein
LMPGVSAVSLAGHAPRTAACPASPMSLAQRAYRASARRTYGRVLRGQSVVVIVVGDYDVPLFTRPAAPRPATLASNHPRRNQCAPVSKNSVRMLAWASRMCPGQNTI